jgi:predicted unusual protein kinase regulating ubiquinone biosynthesis (AarF/ABC1/UbiB family)
MANTFLALIRKDFDGLIDQYIELGLVPEHVDLEAFRKGFKADLADFLEPLYGLSIKEINFAEYLDTVTHLAIKHQMKIPSELLLINKAMLILENIGAARSRLRFHTPPSHTLQDCRRAPEAREALEKACKTSWISANSPSSSQAAQKVVQKVLRDDFISR